GAHFPSELRHCGRLRERYATGTAPFVALLPKAGMACHAVQPRSERAVPVEARQAAPHVFAERRKGLAATLLAVLQADEETEHLRSVAPKRVRGSRLPILLLTS